jgi:hypothetical protein
VVDAGAYAKAKISIDEGVRSAFQNTYPCLAPQSHAEEKEILTQTSPLMMRNGV